MHKADQNQIYRQKTDTIGSQYQESGCTYTLRPLRQIFSICYRLI